MSPRLSKCRVRVAVPFVAMVILVSLIVAPRAESAQPVNGVSPTTIKIGITYVDLAAIQNIINLNSGNAVDAYTALIKQINSRGGIDGRKIVPIFESIDPLGTAPAATAC